MKTTISRKRFEIERTNADAKRAVHKLVDNTDGI